MYMRSMTLIFSILGGSTSSRPQSKSSKKNFQRSESFQQSHFFVNAQMQDEAPHPGGAPPTVPILPPPPPPAHSAPTLKPTGAPTTPSLSPISVVRNKRANQANWEKHQSRKNSVVNEAGLGVDGVVSSQNLVDNCVSQGLVTPILGRILHFFLRFIYLRKNILYQNLFLYAIFSSKLKNENFFFAKAKLI